MLYRLFGRQSSSSSAPIAALPPRSLNGWTVSPSLSPLRSQTCRRGRDTGDEFAVRAVAPFLVAVPSGLRRGRKYAAPSAVHDRDQRGAEFLPIGFGIGGDSVGIVIRQRKTVGSTDVDRVVRVLPARRRRIDRQLQGAAIGQGTRGPTAPGSVEVGLRFARLEVTNPNLVAHHVDAVNLAAEPDLAQAIHPDADFTDLGSRTEALPRPPLRLQRQPAIPLLDPRNSKAWP